MVTSVLLQENTDQIFKAIEQDDLQTLEKLLKPDNVNVLRNWVSKLSVHNLVSRSVTIMYHMTVQFDNLLWHD